MNSAVDQTPLILIVEDNPGDARLSREAFRETQHAHEAVVARDGMEALDYLFKRAEFSDAQRPDLILFDLKLPKKGGREVLSDIKAESPLLNVAVAVFSSSSAPPDVSAAYKLHVNCYVTEPADLDELFAAIGWIAKFWLGTATFPRGSPDYSRQAAIELQPFQSEGKAAVP